MKKEYWSDIETEYGKDWPNYRIPTGVTTSEKPQLIQWVSKNVHSDADFEEIIEEYNVDVAQPDSIIEQSKNIDKVHLLQVDAEGMDDKIVYSFLEDEIYPNIINIESKYLTEDRQKKYDNKLTRYNYDIYIYQYTHSEKLAIRK